ncbi:hypothetical protein [Polymorphobacter megasporae]|uniref:hypothetical protein n=1 Tax=Glacieibacterium megasporae TaxID=2835787 RepID=UPI001C1DFDA6|nr:hypothetical protein [Polymorphobacter megasporae]UAJ12390.1 hypothetical protein KTC28_21500 [Polymorphobacter megasporae]
MNMIDQSRMATPPAPQPPYLRRLRLASATLCLVTALGVAGIEPIRQFSIYAVGVVAVSMIGAIVTVLLYWVLCRRVEAAYWTPAREAAHIDSVVRGIDLRRAEGRGRPASGRRDVIVLDRRAAAPEGVFTRLWAATVRLRRGHSAKWWTPR